MNVRVNGGEYEVEAARELWRVLPEVEDEGEQRIVSRTTFRLVHLADILAVTSGA